MKRFTQILCGVVTAFVLAGSIFTPIGEMDASVVQAAEYVDASADLQSGDLKEERVKSMN